MFVVVLVAVVAAGPQLDAVQLAGMAGIAANGAMHAVKLVFGVLVMIEDDVLPFFFVMTFFALVVVAAGMDIVDAVAGHALPCQVLVTLIGMTAVAGRFLVFAM